eukprot:scaffold1357_cov97-Isochrysis_galbana.AAC.5
MPLPLSQFTITARCVSKCTRRDTGHHRVQNTLALTPVVSSSLGTPPQAGEQGQDDRVHHPVVRRALPVHHPLRQLVGRGRRADGRAARLKHTGEKD